MQGNRNDPFEEYTNFRNAKRGRLSIPSPDHIDYYFNDNDILDLNRLEGLKISLQDLASLGVLGVHQFSFAQRLENYYSLTATLASLRKKQTDRLADINLRITELRQPVRRSRMILFQWVFIRFLTVLVMTIVIDLLFRSLPLWISFLIITITTFLIYNHSMLVYLWKKYRKTLDPLKFYLCQYSEALRYNQKSASDCWQNYQNLILEADKLNFLVDNIITHEQIGISTSKNRLSEPKRYIFYLLAARNDLIGGFKAKKLSIDNPHYKISNFSSETLGLESRSVIQDAEEHSKWLQDALSIGESVRNTMMDL